MTTPARAATPPTLRYTDAPADPRWSDAELAARREAASRLMAENGYDALLFYGNGRASEVHYLADWPGTRESYLLVPREGEPRLWVQLFNHFPLAQEMSRVPVAWGGPDNAVTIAEHLGRVDLGKGRIGLVGQVPFQTYLKLRELLPEVELASAGRPWQMLRTVKSAEEIDRLRVAVEYTDRAMDALLARLRPGVSEHELADAIESAYRPIGGTLGIHFMASMPQDNPTVGVPRQIQSNRRLEVGDVLITEISAGYAGTTGQVHRTYFVGREPNDLWRRLHEVAMGTYDRIEAVLRDGVKLDEVLDAAEYVHEQGLTIYDDLIHGVNQLPPILKTRRTSHSNPKDFTFRAGMVIVIQPNVVTDDVRAGLQYGETVLVTATGTERLHRTPRQYFVTPG